MVQVTYKGKTFKIYKEMELSYSPLGVNHLPEEGDVMVCATNLQKNTEKALLVYTNNRWDPAYHPNDQDKRDAIENIERLLEEHSGGSLSFKELSLTEKPELVQAKMDVFTQTLKIV